MKFRLEVGNAFEQISCGTQVPPLSAADIGEEGTQRNACVSDQYSFYYANLKNIESQRQKDAGSRPKRVTHPLGDAIFYEMSTFSSILCFRILFLMAAVYSQVGATAEMYHVQG